MYIDFSKKTTKDSEGNLFTVEVKTDNKITQNKEGGFVLVDGENEGELSISLTKIN